MNWNKVINLLRYRNIKKVFTLSNFFKHFTITNVIATIFGIFVGCLIKFTFLGHAIFTFLGINPIEIYIYIFGGIGAFLARSGIKGFVEGFLDVINPIETAYAMGPSEGGDNISNIAPSYGGKAHNGQGGQAPGLVCNGFTVINGVYNIDNPTGVKSYYINAQPNTSPEIKIIFGKINSAFVHRSDSLNKVNTVIPIMDNNASNIFYEYMENTRPGINRIHMFNSKVIREQLKSLSE